MTLADTLRGIREAAEKRFPADKAAIMHRATEELRHSGILDRVVRIGNTLPPFALPNTREEIVRSADLLAEGPLVLSFYRGAW